MTHQSYLLQNSGSKNSEKVSKKNQSDTSCLEKIADLFAYLCCCHTANEKLQTNPDGLKRLRLITDKHKK